MQAKKQPLRDHGLATILYTFIAALSYVACGAMVGWSSGALHRGRSGPQLDNWTISLIATPAAVLAITACFVHRWYLWIGTKSFLLAAALLSVGSATLEALAPSFAPFWCASVSRVLAGIGAGIAFTLVPSYVAELGAATAWRSPWRSLVDELVTAAFPLGILLRFTVDLLPVRAELSPLLCGAFGVLTFVACLFLPESAQYLCAAGRPGRATTMLQRTHGTDLATQQAMQGLLERWQQRSNPAASPCGLLEAVRRQGNLTLLLPLLALFAFQACVGAVPLLFYLSDVLELIGVNGHSDHGLFGGQAAAAALLAAVFTVTGPLLGWLLRQRLQDGNSPHRVLLLTSTLLMALTMLALGWQCHVRGTHSPAPHVPVPAAHQNGPLIALALYYTCYTVGFHRLPGKLLDAELDDAELRFPLHTLATAISWGTVYVAVRLLPVLLRAIGIGWLFWNVALVALFAVVVLIVSLPSGGDCHHPHRRPTDLPICRSCATPCPHCAYSHPLCDLPVDAKSSNV
ncbi:uncharacterized protein LOC131213192 [Anopheles bellator]|uniref:uncharacterized protein LOC131213192 n=1 Tax=Anopheles bellator TaxID=139047 RepID=UPI002648D421|nr:uncharacterized protein LOC131213192 [Anopheles bellator]